MHDLVWLNHDTWDISTEKVIIITITKSFCIGIKSCSRHLVYFVWSFARAFLYDQTSLHVGSGGIYRQSLLRNDNRIVSDSFYFLCQLFNPVLTFLKCLIKLFVYENMVLVAVLEISVFFLQYFDVFFGSLQLFFEPLYALLELFDVFTLVVRTVLDANWCGSGGDLASVHCVVSRRWRTHFWDITRAKILIGRYACSANLLSNLVQHFLWVICLYFVLENRDFFYHHILVLNLTVLKSTQHRLQLLSH